MRRVALLQSVLICCILATPAVARGQSLAKALELARDNEPTYLGAKASYAVSQEKSRQAFAGLLPQVTASANTNMNQRNYVTRNSTIPPVDDTYNSNNRQVNVTQPIWRHANVIGVRQAEAVVSQAEYQLAAAEQELLARLIAAWCDAMLARDALLFAERQVAATKQQWEIHKRGVELGIATAPAREESRTRYDQALSEKITAETDLQVKTAVLEQVIGPLRSFSPPFLSAQLLKEHDLSGNSLDVWLETVENNSPSILAAVQALAAANEEINKQRAGHEPTLDLVGSYAYNAQSAGNFPGQSGYEIKQGALGVQLNIPLYAGGGQNARVREAIAVREKARQDLEAARRAARLAAKQAWFAWHGGSGRQTASLQAIESSILSLKAARVGEATGLKTELELLQARQQLESARRDLNRARYDMITSVFKLKAVAGQLGNADVLVLDKLLRTESNDVPPDDRSGELPRRIEAAGIQLKLEPMLSGDGRR